jgi:flagellar hook-associated protein 3 FlgL
MRIVDQAFYIRFLTGLNASRERTASALESLGDGRRVRVGSDDPGGVRESISLRARVARLAGLDRSAQAGRADLATIDDVLGEVATLLTAARNEAMAGASDGFDDANEVRANEIDSTREQLLQLANTIQRGRYLFGGTETLTAPFAADGSYGGNTEEAQTPLDRDQQVGTTMAGGRVFLDAVDIFTLMQDLAAALRDNRTDDVEALIPDLTAALEHVIQVRADVGDRLTRIDRAVERHGSESLTLLQRISEIEDADLAQVIVDLDAAQSSTDALSAAVASVLGRSLFDYLG